MSPPPSPLTNSITLAELLPIAAARRVALAPELAGYLVLEIAEGGATAGSGLDAKNVFIGEEGTVGIVQPKGDLALAGSNLEQALRNVLLELLEASGAQTPGLLAVAKRSSAGGDIAGLISQLESALIPVNRAAGRRALARLVREAKRVQLGVGRNAAPPKPEVRKEASPLSSKSPPSIPVLGSILFGSPKLSEPPKAEMPFQIEKEDIDQLLRTFEISELKPEVEMARELKSIAGLEPTPPPPGASPVDDDDSIEDLLKLSEPLAPSARPQAPPPLPKPVVNAQPPASRTATSLTRAASAPPLTASSDPPTKIEAMDAFIEDRKRVSPPSSSGSKPPPPSGQTHARSASSLSSRPGTKAALGQPQRPQSSSTKLVVLALLATLLVGMAAVYFLFPKLIPGILQPERERANPSAASASQAPVPQCRGRVVVRKAPADAEVLLRVGTAPTEVPRLPIGTRIEFVATAEGFAPRRGVVLPTAAWTRDAQPSFDLSITLPASKKSSAEAWPPAEAGTQVGGRGEPGLVRVSSAPVVGAEIWLLAGLGPEASYEPLPCDRESELLVAGPTTYRKRIRITPADLEKAPEGQTKGLRILEVVVRSD
jgi:hypothetical protein